MKGKRITRITKFRLKNPYFLIAAGVMLVLMFAGWLIEGHIIQLYKGATNLSPEFVKALEAEGKTKESFTRDMLASIFDWEGTVASAYYYLVYTFPLFPVFSALPFVMERRTYLGLGVCRFPNANAALRRVVLHYGLVGGLSISVPVSIFNTIMAPFVDPGLPSIGGFLDAFPKDFYPHHAYVVFMVMAWTVYFAFGFVFAVLACGVALWKANRAVVLAAPLLLYLTENYIATNSPPCLPIEIKLCLAAFNTNYSTWQVFVPLIPVLCLALILVEGRIRLRKGWSVD